MKVSVMSFLTFMGETWLKGKRLIGWMKKVTHRQKGRNMKGMLNQIKEFLVLAMRSVGAYWSLSLASQV